MLEGRAIRILPMKLTNLAVVAGLFFVAAGDLPAASLSVAGDANIFSAGHSGPPGGIGQGQSAPFRQFRGRNVLHANLLHRYGQRDVGWVRTF